MSSTISTLAHAIWAWLPEITTSLQFATALLGFCLSATLTIQRLRRSMHRLSLKFFGNLFLGQSGQAEGAVGEVVVECLEADGCEDDVVDSVEVAAVWGGRDSPVLDVGEGSFRDSTY